MKTFFIGIILGVILISANMQVSDSAMGKLLVSVKPEKTPLSSREYPIIIGTVTDEASKPIGNAKIKLTFAREVITTTTDSNGNFRYDSVKPSSPGQYAINVVATKEGYSTGFGSSNYFVNTPAPVTYSKGTKGTPLTVGNYTIYLGKVTEWNLEDTCFIVFGDEYKRFLNTCDLYNMAPEDFKKPTKMISVLAVMKYNSEYRLFPVAAYYDAIKQSEDSKTQYVINTWNHYAAPNQ